MPASIGRITSYNVCYTKLLRALILVRQRLQQAKLRQQLLGFDDLLSGLARALEGPSADLLAGRIREQYPVAMIDEFSYNFV